MERDPATADSPDLAALAGEAAAAARRMVLAAREVLAREIAPAGRVEAARLDAHQYAAHGLAWLATYAEALTQMAAWAGRLDTEGRLGEMERLLLGVGCGEYLRQMAGGIPMSQGEVVRPDEAGVPDDALAAFTADTAVRRLSAANSDAARRRLAELLAASEGAPTFGATGLDEEMELVREQFRRFADERVLPHAHGWHLRDELIPLELVAEMGELGVFGLTIPEEWGGAGMGKTAMCVVSEELSRGYIGVGSLGTRSEIAAELILGGGTEAQKDHWLPRIASGEVLPTAVFTEPNVGSDLGALRTRAERVEGGWAVTGTKTWITHAARADLMTLLARTDPGTDDYRGLSMFLAPKTRGSEAEPFPDPGIDGEEIPVLGYRGMKEYTLSFDGFRVADEGLLGGEDGLGQGFRQLMRTFESARIQTAARAIGVAQSALELALRYAQERVAFGRALIAFPRVAAKLAMMAAEIMIARQLTYFAASQKDAGHRSDLEAGMAKLLAARVAWAAADNGVQIHGGNGFALEYPISRVLCDARILSIFEGAAEIQAQVIARRLLGGN